MNKEENKEPKDKLRPDEDTNAKDLPYNPEITPEDEQALPDEGLSMNQDRDRFLAERERPADFTADGLDIPGRNERDTSDAREIPDEENQQYNMRGTRSEEDKKRENENELINEKTRKDEEQESSKDSDNRA